MSVVKKSIATTKLRDGLKKFYRLRFPQPIFLHEDKLGPGLSILEMNCTVIQNPIYDFSDTHQLSFCECHP